MKNQLLLEKYIIRVLKEQEDRSDIGEYPLNPIDPKTVKPKGKITALLISAAMAINALIPASQFQNAVNLDREYDHAVEIPKEIAEELAGGNKELEEEIKDQVDNIGSGTSSFAYDASNIDRDQVISRLRVHEGERLEPYYDSEGYKTVGIGTLITKQGQNKSAANQSLSYAAANEALQKLSQQYPDIYQHTPGNISITKEQAEELLQVKFDSIHGAFTNRIGANYQYLPKELKEVLADMAYNMGANFFSGSNFIKNVLRLAELLAKNESGLSTDEKKEIVNLVKLEIPKEFADSDYFDVLTSHDVDPTAAGRPAITSSGEFNWLTTTYEGRPINLLNIYQPMLDQFTIDDINESYSLKSVYDKLFS
jgi:GH24 family phage-related lysozyme (muramidase)